MPPPLPCFKFFGELCSCGWMHKKTIESLFIFVCGPLRDVSYNLLQWDDKQETAVRKRVNNRPTTTLMKDVN
jgi:hypothetical protein